MMSSAGDVAVRVEGLGKEYRLGQRERYSSLRDALTLAVNPKNWRRRPRETFWALRDVSFELRHGEILGLIGRNGAGKSTLLKILSRITVPTEGRAELYGRVGSLLEVGTGFHPELTGRENIFLSGAILGMRRHEIVERFDQIVAFAEVERFLDTQVKHYSSGMFMRLAFSVAAHLQPEILLVDEVLAVGDAAFQEKCINKMQDVSSSGRTVVYVSHNMDSIRKLCTKAMHLDKGRTRAVGKVDEIIDQYLAMFHASESSATLQFGARRGDFAIERIDVLDTDGHPMPSVSTWDAVRFRIVFQSARPFTGGSVVFRLSTLTGVSLIVCSTQPDQSIKVDFKAGTNEIDLVIPRLELAAGKYLVGAALAVPFAERLVQAEPVVFEVSARDVFHSGFSARSPRATMVIEHRWELR